MGKLGKKPKKQRAPEEQQAEMPDVETLELAGRRSRSRKRQNNTVLGSIPGRTLG